MSLCEDDGGASGSARASRPGSLALDGAQPEKEPLQFDVQLVGAPPEVEQLVNNIKQVAEDFLYHWKTFPIVLPPSRFSQPGASLSDIILAPPCDELEAAALDASSEPHPLSPKQLHSIREKGEFEVPSRHFPGLVTVWRLAGWLQRGRTRLREDLYDALACSAALLLVSARGRLLRHERFSVLAGMYSLAEAAHRLLDLIFGMPSLEARDLDKKIREERSRYLVAELICKPEHQDDITALAAWVMRGVRRANSEKSDPRAPRALPPVPCVYTTPQGILIDLRLYRRDILKRAAPILQEILERESRGWFLHYRERLAQQLTRQKMPVKDIEEEVRRSGLKEYTRRVAACVLEHAGLRALGAGVPELLHDQLHATYILTRAEDSVRQKLEAAVAAARARISARHPVLARAAAWRSEREHAQAARTTPACRVQAMEEAAAAMAAHELHQHRYFVLRDQAFLRDREPLLIKELKSAKTPTREFTWSTRIWCPSHWVVTRHFRGRAEPVPTVLSSRATSIVTPRSDPSQPVFVVEKEVIRTTSTSWPLCRLRHTAHRAWSWGWNLMFLFGVLVPWCSPLSLRTLVQTAPFVPDWELSQVNGTLFPKRNSETQTMWSRLLLLWRLVSKERTRFETEPDTGLLGKGLSRQANRLWNYGVVGALGSIALLLLFPIAVVVVSLLSLAVAITVPLWAPPLALAVHATNALVYDLDCPDPKRLNRWFVLFEVLIWRILILGILQPIAALVTALVIFPICSLLILIGGVTRWWLRRSYESLTFLLLARCGRAPTHDSAYCRRHSAPRAVHQLNAGGALAAICARAEQNALVAWARRAEAAVDKPLRDYRHFVAACFGPFSVQIASTGAYLELEKECGLLTASLREKVAARRRDLALALTDAARRRVRMTAPDLRRALQAAARELAQDDPQAGWSRAATLLLEVFDSDILVPLEEGCPRVPLECGLGAAAWSALCRDEAPPDVLADRDDWLTGMHIEWGSLGVPRVAAPSLELGAFSPRAAPHPPAPPPPRAAIVLYNRDADTPVPLDCPLVAELLKQLEDAPDTDDRRGVERYRGGGSEQGSGSSDDAQDEPDASRVSACTERAACRWTLTGRGVRLRADLASPEDVTLDSERANMGTSV